MIPARLCIRRIDARAGAWRVAPHLWLSVAEQNELAHWGNPARRDEWLAGRWLLKEMILRMVPGLEPGAEIEILSCDPLGRCRRPCILAVGRALPFHVSLAHAGRIVWAAVSTSPHCRVGIDVVAPGSVNRQMGELWFTDGEQDRLQQARDPSLAARLWAVKEAVYKATNRGEPFVPARIAVSRSVSGRYAWSRDGVPQGPDDRLFVRWSAGVTIALAIVNVGPETGVCHD